MLHDAGISMMRDYGTVAATVAKSLSPDAGRDRRMQTVVDRLWEHLQDTGVSWVGFYLYVAEREEMVLGPRRDKPACSPISLHGACGRAFCDDAALIVRDVKELGENYIACDPKDRSEVVLPIHDAGGAPIGVLDLDSFDVGSFDETDVAGLQRVLAAAGLRRK
ncbi:MAG: GAF domain-containing protein [Planctomycetes bacterium]|nr:GAF domain-containing protein [Planctomycetota bacterium]